MEQEGQLVEAMQTLLLDLPPSCIEFCPSYPDYFVVGTYDLQKDSAEASHQQSQTRNGSLLVFRLNGDKVYVLSRGS